MSEAAVPTNRRSRGMEGGRLWLAVFAGLLAAAMLAGICLGRLPIAPATVLQMILGRWLPGEHHWSALEENIVILVRAPRILIAAISGIGLAMAGAALQGLFRNPLVSPDILGITAGAAFGGALAILLGAAGLPLIGAAFALGIVALVL